MLVTRAISVHVVVTLRISGQGEAKKGIVHGLSVLIAIMRLLPMDI